METLFCHKINTLGSVSELFVFIVWADPENSSRGRLDNFLFSSTYFTEGRTNLPREAIGLKGSNCFSRVCDVLDSNLLSSRFFFKVSIEFLSFQFNINFQKYILLLNLLKSN